MGKKGRGTPGNRTNTSTHRHAPSSQNWPLPPSCLVSWTSKRWENPFSILGTIPNQLMLNGSRINKPLKLHLIYRIPVTLNPLLQDVLLFYYTQWCGFCSVLNHVIIQLARLLQDNGTITVARCGVCMFDCWCTQYFSTLEQKKLFNNSSLAVWPHFIKNKMINTFCLCRVNVARNDLPWEFMVDRVPSILLFPKYR